MDTNTFTCIIADAPAGAAVKIMSTACGGGGTGCDGGRDGLYLPISQ